MGSSIPILDFVPVGFRFRPTEEELVDHYLKQKLLGNDSMVHSVIAEIDVCKYEPWDLPEFSAIKSDDPEWFFFCPRDYKYAKSKRLNRKTKCGFWKPTGNDRNIKTRGTDKVIGTKKTLVFHKGPVPGVKTNWVIHEYHAVTFDESQRTFVLCHLMKKAEKRAGGGTDTLICDEGEPSRHIGSDYENQATIEGIPDVDGILPEMDMKSIFQATHQTDIYFPSSTQQSPIGIEQEISFPNSPFANAYFGNENHIIQTPFETTEEENEFTNSMLISEDFVINEKRGHAFVNGTAQSESLRMVYSDSSDTDIEVASALVGGILPEMDMGSIFQATHQADIYFPSLTQQYPIGIEQEISFPNSPSANAYFGNENHIIQTLFETTEEENEFTNSMLISEGFVTNEKRGHAFVNGPDQSESLRLVYNDSSDTDAEVASALVGGILPEMDMESILQATHQADIYFPSSTQQSPIGIEQEVSFLNSPSANAYFGNGPAQSEALRMVYIDSSDTYAEVASALCGNILNTSTVHHDDFWGVETSSCDSTANKPLEISTIEISSSPFQYHPRPSNFISDGNIASPMKSPHH